MPTNGPYELNTRTGLPTQRCDQDRHDHLGGACEWCCPRCNWGRHACPGCDEQLHHDGSGCGGPHECPGVLP